MGETDAAVLSGRRRRDHRRRRFPEGVDPRPLALLGDPSLRRKARESANRRGAGRVEFIRRDWALPHSADRKKSPIPQAI